MTLAHVVLPAQTSISVQPAPIGWHYGIQDTTLGNAGGDHLDHQNELHADLGAIEAAELENITLANNTELSETDTSPSSQTITNHNAASCTDKGEQPEYRNMFSISSRLLLREVVKQHFLP